MDLKLDEQLLVGNFRKLSAEARQQVLDLTASLVSASADPVERVEPDDRCVLPRKETRPEATPEPLFTE